MSYVFRIHKQHNGLGADASLFTTGWRDSNFLEGPIIQEINAGSAVGRMGTSIPSVFARPMLFETAFNSVDSLSHDGNGLSQQLISEALDMLEFLYMNGANPNLSTEDWVAQTQIAELKKSPNRSHHKLAEVLENNLDKIGNPNKITLFFWEDYPSGQQGGQKIKTLIGGTSQSTLVFVSPNWKRKVQEYGWNFNCSGGSKLFGNTIRPLKDRNNDFSTMLFELVRAYDDTMSTQCNSAGMYSYIQDTIKNMGINVPPMAPSAFLNKYNVVRGNTFAGGIPICFKPIDLQQQSGYQIRPTAQRYMHALAAGGGAVNVKTPLVLKDDGLPGVPYVGGTSWKPEYKIDSAHVRTTDIYNRNLPGNMGITYPYLTEYDFIEDKIIKVGEIRQDKFLTLFDGVCSYLLPLKPRFFDYFNVEDLKGVNPYTGRKLVELTADQNTVTLTINVPIEDPTYKSIELSKKFTAAEIIDFKNFELGFFPFYKVPANPALNVYKVLCSSGNDNTAIKFYAIDNNVVASIVSPSNKRAGANQLAQGRAYYDVTNAFDFVEVVTPNSVSGMLIPQMEEKTLGAKNLNFAVDFGTSNTYIAMHDPDGKATIEPLSINDTDAQVVFMRKARQATMLDVFLREFMPETIGTPDSQVKFPIKTAVFEVTEFINQQSYNLFGNINIGFNFKNELSAQALRNGRYFTNIKWALEDNPGDQVLTWRVQAFCKQILWMLKNKSILNGGSDNFKVMLTFPEAMVDRSVFFDRATEMGAWNIAAKDLGLSQTIFDVSVTESEAPYYEVVTGNDNVLNVDIGGGTTDMFFVQRKDENGNILGSAKASFLSVKYAANDLWGGGNGAHRANIENNGFCQYIINTLGTEAPNFSHLASDSADVMALLFSNPGYNVTQKLRNHANLKCIILLHYTALLFSVARIIKKLNAGIPDVISFTGMGSRYLSLIHSDESRLSRFTSEILRQLTGKDVPTLFRLQTNYQGAKEVTAKGALSVVANLKPQYIINDSMKQAIVDLGIDSTDWIKYQDVRNGDTANRIRKEALNVFEKFLEMLRSDDFQRVAAAQFDISISPEMIDDLGTFATPSYNNELLCKPQSHNHLPVKDNLFFWFLKDSLCQLSLKYYNK